MLEQLAAILRGNAIEQLGRVEGPRHVAGPLLQLEQPLQNDREDLVRIDDVPVLIDGAADESVRRSFSGRSHA